jgi:type IV pilus assembly protein PilN
MIHMRYPINLASEPFRRNRAMIVASSVLAGLLVLTLGLLVLLIVNERDQKRDVREATAQAEAQLARLATEQSTIEASMRKAENADVLERSVFLNTLIARKGVSWTKLFGDLESVMPHNVRLVAIRPQTDPKNNIQLEMTVGAQSVEPVVDLLKKMEGSGIFSVPSVANCLPPSQSEPLYRCRVSVNYAQKL